MLIKEAIELWLHAKRPNTKRQYVATLSDFLAFLDARSFDAFADVTLLDCVKYLKTLEKRDGQAHRVTGETKLSASTVRHKMVILRGFFELLVRHRVRLDNPWIDPALKPPACDFDRKRPTERIPNDKVIEMFAACDLRTPRGIQDRAMLTVLFGGGLRRSELVNLRVADVKISEAGSLFLELRGTKSGRDSVQVLPDWVTESLSALVAQRKAERAKPSDWLFTSPGGQLGEKTVERRFKWYCRAVKLPPIYSPHSARASAITKLLEDGAAHRDVQEFARHSSAAMVDVYDKRIKSLDLSLAKKLCYG